MSRCSFSPRFSWCQRRPPALPGGLWLTVLAAAALAGGCGARPPAATPAGAVPGAAAGGFTDITEAAGVRFLHDNGAYGKKLFPEIMGSGAALFDADGDGDLDLFLVNGSPMPGHPKPAPQPSRFYRNRGDGTFEDRTAGSGLQTPGYGMGAAVGDVDNDGDEDLYVTRVGKNSLYLNRGDGTFTDGTAASGTTAGGFSTSAAFLDYDQDGMLDLYVCGYVPWTGLKDDFLCLNPRGKKQYCDVHVYEGIEHRLFRNLGGGRFQDVSRAAGVAGRTGRGLAVVCGDYDMDGDPDILVANDTTPNFLWKNEGGGRLREAAAEANFAFNAAGNPTAGMGLDLADADGDGSFDVIESDFQDERKNLYLNDGLGFFTPNAANKGLGNMILDRLTFGIGFLDYDLDGWQDLFLCNGHVIDDVEEFSPRIRYAQTSQLFRNGGGALYQDVSSLLGSYEELRRVGRGTAFGDLDNDGDTDLVVVNNHQPAAVLRNDVARKGHWVGFRCVGKKSNRSGLNVLLTLEAGERTLLDETRAASSYLSSSDPRVVFGLGPVDRVDRVSVRWPGGAVQEFPIPAVDRYYTLVEGEPAPQPAP